MTGESCDIQCKVEDCLVGARGLTLKVRVIITYLNLYNEVITHSKH